MRLYYSDTLHPRKVCALARHLGAPVTFVYVDFARGEQQAPAFLALNPNGQAPVLEDGGFVLTESNAIMCHLSVHAGTDLWPRDAARQIAAVRWMSWDADRFTRHGGTLYFEHIVKPRFGIGAPDAEAVEAAQRQFRRAAAVLDAHLDGRDWLLGNDLSVADFIVAAALPYAEAARIPLGGFSCVSRWHDRLNALPAWRDPYPDPARAAAAAA